MLAPDENLLHTIKEGTAKVYLFTVVIVMCVSFIRGFFHLVHVCKSKATALFAGCNVDANAENVY